MFLQVDGPVLTEVTFQAIWPPVVLRLPRSHTALTSAVTLEIDSRARCTSLLHREFLTLELHFQRIEDTGSAFGKLSAAELIAERNLTSVVASVAADDDDEEEEEDGGRKRRVSYVSYPCELFDLDGSYQVLLRSSAGVKAVAVSNVMTLTFSASYHLSSWSASVFPCRENATLDVLYTHAPCSGVDRFRLYRLVREAPGSAASPLERVYVAEFPTDPDRTVMAFNCSLFQQQEEEEGEAVGYCFIYVTVSRSGAVVEQKQLCLPSQPGAGTYVAHVSRFSVCFTSTCRDREDSLGTGDGGAQDGHLAFHDSALELRCACNLCVCVCVCVRVRLCVWQSTSGKVQVSGETEKPVF